MTTRWRIKDYIPDPNTGKARWQIYHILKGGMGVVHIVYDREWREAFAIKTFQESLFARNPMIGERFTQEALAWVNLDVHQNVVRARMVQKIEGRPYLFLEYVSGGELSGWLGTPRLTEDLPQVLRFAVQLCNGMTHALSKGIQAHRDIKPQNCLITEDGTLKVTDFGLAKVFDDVQLVQKENEVSQGTGLHIGLSRTGTAAGTCTHMAPEQFEDAKHVDVRADIYAFGVVLYQMLTGQLPFTVQKYTLTQVWDGYRHLHQTQSPPKLKTQNAELETIVQKCLAKDPDHRFADFIVLREQLAHIYSKLTGQPAPQPVSGEALDAVQWINKGVSLGNLGQTEAEVACYERALELNPNYAAAWCSKGFVLFNKLKQYHEALACFEQAERLGLSQAAQAAALCRKKLREK